MAQDEIEEHLVKIWPKTAHQGEIARVVGKDPSTVADQLGYLVRKHSVEKVRRGEYRANIGPVAHKVLKEAGEEAVAAELLPYFTQANSELRAFLAKRHKRNVRVAVAAGIFAVLDLALFFAFGVI